MNEKGTDCIDIDECSSGEHNCHVDADCENTESGFFCSCPAGYSGNGIECTKVQVCGISDVCDPSSTCNEQVDLGLYGCDCPPGTMGNGFTGCVETKTTFCMPPCVIGELCVVNTVTGVPACHCSPGYQNINGKCVDINECDSNPCAADRECVNLIGSFHCICKSGYTQTILPNGELECENTDECKMGSTMCSANAFCIDLDPSEGSQLPYQCVCKARHSQPYIYV